MGVPKMTGTAELRMLDLVLVGSICEDECMDGLVRVRISSSSSFPSTSRLLCLLCLTRPGTHNCDDRRHIDHKLGRQIVN